MINPIDSNRRYDISIVGMDNTPSLLIPSVYVYTRCSYGYSSTGERMLPVPSISFLQNIDIIKQYPRPGPYGEDIWEDIWYENLVIFSLPNPANVGMGKQKWSSTNAHSWSVINDGKYTRLRFKLKD